MFKIAKENNYCTEIERCLQLLATQTNVNAVSGSFNYQDKALLKMSTLLHKLP